MKKTQISKLYSKRFLFWILPFLLRCPLQAGSLDCRFVVTIPSYNNEAWCEKNLESVFSQTYPNYRVIYIDDASSDATPSLVESVVKNHTDDYRVLFFTPSEDNRVEEDTRRFCELVNERPSFFTLVHNTRRSGALANLYRAVHSTADEEIVVNIDGDDSLSRDDVFEELNRIYLADNVWLTHGRFIEFPGGRSDWSLPVPPSVIEKNGFRKYRLPSHLRTYYSWLFKKIRPADLLHEGNFYPMTSDMAIMFPMIEMAGERHAYVKNVNYVYNMENPLNDGKVNPQLQRDLDARIRSLPPYSRISDEDCPLNDSGSRSLYGSED